MDNDKTYGEGQVCAGQISAVEGAAAAKEVNVATPTATAPTTTAATGTATMAAPATESTTMATTLTKTAVAAPIEGEQCISGVTTTSAETTVPATAGHMHAAAAAAFTKWIPEAAVGTTSGSMTGRGDRKIWE